MSAPADPMDYSLPSSSVRGISQATVAEWVSIPFSGNFPTQGLNPGLLHCLPSELLGKLLLCFGGATFYVSFGY